MNLSDRLDRALARLSPIPDADPPPNGAELAAFRVWVHAMMRSATATGALAVAALLLVFWPLDSIVFAPDVQALYGAMRLQLILICLVALVCLRAVPPGPTNVAISVGLTLSLTTTTAWHLATIDGLLGIQYLYALPLIGIIIPVAPILRLPITLALGLSGWLSVVVRRGEIPELALGTLNSTIGVVGLSLMFGDWLYRLMRGRHVSEQRLSALTAHLERRVAQQSRHLRALSRALMDARDSERRWLSRELHDALGQELTALRCSVDLAQLQLELGRTGLVTGTLDEVGENLGRTHETLRRILAHMRPEAVEQLGLAEALRSLVDEIDRSSSLHAELALSVDTDTIDSELADTIYRIVQEALTNVVRHANASTTTVRLEPAEDGLHLEIRDDGQGLMAMGPGDGDDDVHTGLLGIRERVLRHHGRVEWSAPGASGFRLSARFPAASPPEPPTAA